MMRPTVGKLFLPLFALILAVSPAAGQNRKLALEKILDPMPDFDPFEKFDNASKYFPDAIDKRARELMIDALTNNQQPLEGHLESFRAEDGRLLRQHGTATGLTGHAQDLLNNTIRDRERYLAAVKDALNRSEAPARRKYLEAIINRDDLKQSEQLMRQSTTNFWGGMTNRLISSVDLLGVASGNFVGAAAETTVSQIYALMDHEMPSEERRALARNLDHLKRFPDDPRNPEIVKQIAALEKKKKTALVRKQIDRAKDAFSKRDFQRALFHAELASYIDAQSKDAQSLRQQAQGELQKIEAERQSSLAAVAQAKTNTDQQRDIARLLEALSLRDTNEIQSVAVELDNRYRGKPLADQARDAEAVALEIKGRHEAATQAIAEIARSSISPEAKERAAALLQSQEYNSLTPFHDARSERRLESVKYVLLGENFLRKNLLFGAGAMAAAGPGAVATLGMANAIMVGTNLYQVMTDNPVSSQPVIDAGIAYVRSHPNAENAAEIYKVLAEAYQERGLFDKAIHYHHLAGSPREKIAALEDQAAKALLNAASKSASRGAREYFLTSVIDHHPDTPAAAEATKKLAELAKEENQGMRMSKQFLLEHAELRGPRGLGLKASLFDGKAENMEIADRGINLVNDREILVYYQTPWGVRSQTYPLSKTAAQRFFVALREKNLQVALSDVNQRAKDSVGGIKDLPGTVARAEGERRGAADEFRDDSNDTTFTLIREAGARGNYPRVLDAQMLSDNERDPASKYKLPPLSGSVSANRFSMTGSLPAGLWGNQLAIGGDHKSPYAGVQLPTPLLEGFIPVDFMIQGRPGGISLYPKLRTGADTGADPELYR